MNTAPNAPYCNLHIEGNDPDRIMPTLAPLFNKGIQSAMANWPQGANP